MITIKQIICLADSSGDEGEAVRTGAAVARAFSAELTVEACRDAADNRHVYADLTTDLGEKLPRFVGMEDLLRRAEREESGEETGAGAAEKINWHGATFDCRDTAESVANAALRQKADLIVLHNERGTFRAIFWGSLAEELTELAPCPLLVTYRDGRKIYDAGENLMIKNIFVAYDDSEFSRLALRYALRFAEASGARIRVLHFFGAERPPAERRLEVLIGEQNSSREAHYRKLVRLLRENLSDASPLWKQIEYAEIAGASGELLLQLASDARAELVCLAAEKSPAFAASDVEQILRHADCAVLIARQQHKREIL